MNESGTKSNGVKMSEYQRYWVELLKDKIKRIDNFPKQGIKFFDWLPILANWQNFGSLISALANQIEKFETKPDVLVAVEARGFLLAAPLALRMGKNVIVARRPNKLPGSIIIRTQKTEYGQDELAIQRGYVTHKNALVIDDVIATGGTYECVKELIEADHGECIGLIGILELPYCQTNPIENCHTIFKAETPDSKLKINENKHT